MRTLFVLVSALALVGLAFWAYRQNYATQTSLRQVDRLQAEIADLREELGVLRAEWAYLNRPARLRELAEINFDRLRLLEMQPYQFGRVADIAAPGEAWPALRGAVDVSGRLEARP